MTTPAITELRSALAAASSDVDRLRAMLALAAGLFAFEPRETVELALAAERLAADGGDDESRAEALRWRAAAGFELGERSSARALYDELAVAARACGRRDLMAHAERGVGSVDLFVGDYSAALDRFMRAREIAEGLGDRALALRCKMSIGHVARLRGEFAEALELYEEVLDGAVAAADEELVTMAMANCAAAHLHLGNDDVALDLNHQVLDRYTAEGSRIGQARTLGDIGNLYHNKRDYARALEHFEAARDSAEELGLRELLARWSAQAAAVRFETGDYVRALEGFGAAIAIHEALDDRAGTAHVLGNIGNVHLRLGQHDQALEHFERAVTISRAIGNRATVATWLIGVAAVHRERGAPEEALRYYREALESAEGLQSIETTCLFNIGESLVECGRYDEALELMRETLDRTAVSDDVFHNALIRASIGDIFADESFAGSDSIAAEEHYLQAIALLPESAAPFVRESFHRSLTSLYERMERWREAHEHAKRVHEIELELRNIEAYRQMQSFEHRQNVAELERRHAAQIERHEHERELQRLRADHLQQQLAAQATAAGAQAEMIDRFRRQMTSVFQEMGEPVQALRRIRETLRTLPRQDLDWAKLEAEFAAAHPDVRARLLQRYPALTPQQVRICLLLYLDLKSTEIARLTNLSERNIEKHRLNIRRVMGLRNGDDLGRTLRAL